MKIMVLGGGLVGGPMATDLASDEDFEVTVVDASEAALQRIGRVDDGIRLIQKDLSDPAVVTALVASHDVVVNAVPGFMGFRTLEAILRAGRHVVDIAFSPEDTLALHRLAEQKGVTAIVDCGVAPGMSNLLVGHVDRLMDRTDTVLIYVGGLPVQRTWPFEYKAVFSPADVIEEYTRPARYVENGVQVTRPALSDPEILHFPGIGTLEAFNTDGLRSLATTIDAPNKKEKTLRYRGHIDTMAVLRACGFFDKQEIEVNGHWIRPLDVTSRLLFDDWKLEEGEADLTVLRVLIEGQRSEERLRYQYDLLDRYCEKTGVHSMARTTGYTATMGVRLLADGLFEKTGVFAPEHVGQDSRCVDFMLRGLEERGIFFEERIERLAS